MATMPKAFWEKSLDDRRKYSWCSNFAVLVTVSRSNCWGDRRTSMAASMRSARLHEPGQPLRIDTVEIPEPRPRDVLVQVKACGIIPNMNAIFSGRLWNHLPPLPASVGLRSEEHTSELQSLR